MFIQEGDPDYTQPTMYSSDEDIGDYSGDSNDGDGSTDPEDDDDASYGGDILIEVSIF